MKNYKGFYLITSFSEEELDLFENFLKSPYHNTRIKPLELFRIIRKIRKKPEAQISKEKIFEKLYPGKKFNSNTFNDLMAQLHRLAEDFLFVESNGKNKIWKDVVLLERFLEGRFKNLFEYKKMHVERLIKGTKEVDSYFYLHGFIKDAVSIGYIQTYKKLKTKKDFQPLAESLFGAVTNITNLYLEEIVAAFLQSRTRGNNLDSSGFPDFIREIIFKLFDNNFLEIFLKKDKNNHTLILLQKLLPIALSKDDKSIYLDFKKNLFKYRKNLTHDQFSYYFGNLSDYCLNNMRSDNRDSFFTNEFFSLFEMTLSNKYYSNPFIKLFRSKLYGNHLSIFFKEKRPDLINKLIKSAAPLLEKKHVAYYLSLSHAYLDYLRGSYQDSLDKVRKIKTMYKENEIRIKIFTIQLQYMLGNTEQVISSVHSYKKYLKAVYDNEVKYTKYLNFAKAVEKITLQKSKNDREEMQYLDKKITEGMPLIEKNWIIERLNEILKNKK